MLLIVFSQKPQAFNYSSLGEEREKFSGLLNATVIMLSSGVLFTLVEAIYLISDFQSGNLH